MLVDLAKLFLRDTSGPFLLGKQVSYADFIVGGWLRMMRGILPDNEWEEVTSWHEGVFERLHDALVKYAKVAVKVIMTRIHLGLGHLLQC